MVKTTPLIKWNDVHFNNALKLLKLITTNGITAIKVCKTKPFWVVAPSRPAIVELVKNFELLRLEDLSSCSSFKNNENSAVVGHSVRKTQDWPCFIDFWNWAFLKRHYIAFKITWVLRL